MCLLNTLTLKLESFVGQPPKYAILSHTWADEEVLLQDMQDLAKASKKEGYSKLHSCCQLAAEDGFRYVWIDTCCIDKTSSAELSEAINSMFAYYRSSAVCYVYLEKIFPGIPPGSLTAQNLENTRWISRGWTLQELIAPADVRFYDRNWNYCGTKQDLSAALSRVTNINEDVLSMSEPHEHICVAERMSWVSTRQTTRPEDIAYCWFGIFDVQLPVLYGRGRGEGVSETTGRDHQIHYRSVCSGVEGTWAIVEQARRVSKFPSNVRPPSHHHLSPSSY
ncbi:HET-domain-containing protein [Setomelanomma holmii]|uniref:HET-domain-containing protein n=1 Tax=Setomelanomma holmii TaxID=210430 RepID=A0A9P4HI69_9PLEO|nr:HET-domain-containing protein [Setomelanomma holmii]